MVLGIGFIPICDGYGISSVGGFMVGMPDGQAATINPSNYQSSHQIGEIKTIPDLPDEKKIKSVTSNSQEIKMLFCYSSEIKIIVSYSLEIKMLFFYSLL